MRSRRSSERAHRPQNAKRRKQATSLAIKESSPGRKPSCGIFAGSLYVEIVHACPRVLLRCSPDVATTTLERNLLATNFVNLYMCHIVHTFLSLFRMWTLSVVSCTSFGMFVSNTKKKLITLGETSGMFLGFKERIFDQHTTDNVECQIRKPSYIL